MGVKVFKIFLASYFFSIALMLPNKSREYVLLMPSELGDILITT